MKEVKRRRRRRVGALWRRRRRSVAGLEVPVKKLLRTRPLVSLSRSWRKKTVFDLSSV